MRWVRSILLWSAVLAAAGAPAAHADDVAVRLELDRTQTAPGEALQATVTVSGTARGGDVELDAPPEVRTRQAGTTRNLQIVNGQVESSTQYLYQLTATHPGAYTIGPARLHYSGDAYTSNTVTLTVTRQAAPPPAAVESDERPAEGVFAEADVDTTTPYVGQQVTYTFHLFRPRDDSMRNAAFVRPETDGLWPEEIDGQSDEPIALNERPYVRHTIRMAFFPTRSGKVTIGPAAVTYEELVRVRRPRPGFGFFDDSFFDMLNARAVPRRVEANALELEVKPLPPLPDGSRPDAPAVGAFTLDATLSDRKLRLGDSATLNLRVSGTGNIRTLPDIQLPSLDGIKAYPDAPEESVTAQGTAVHSERKERIALVPQKTGELHVPAITLPVFDPKTGKWEILRSPEYDLEVSPGESQEPVVAAAPPNRPAAPRRHAPRLAADLLAPHPVTGPVPLPGTGARWIAIGTGGGAPLLCLASWWLRRRRAALAADPTLARRQRAGRVARQALRGDGALGADAVAAVLANYVADRLGLPRGSVTGDEALAVIQRATPDVAAAAGAIIRSGEAARYGGGAAGAAAMHDAVRVLDALDDAELTREASHA